jgi:hypothetical protein
VAILGPLLMVLRAGKKQNEREYDAPGADGLGLPPPPLISLISSSSSALLCAPHALPTGMSTYIHYQLYDPVDVRNSPFRLLVHDT